MIHFLIALALCYVLIKIPFWALGSIRGGGRSLVGSLVRGFIAYKTFGLLRGLGGGKASKLRSGAQKSAASTDPYARTRTTPTGQYMLPLNVKRVPTSPRRQTGPAPKPRPRPSGAKKGRQLALPLDGEWPENKPRLGRDGQYRLPFEVQRQPKPTPAPTAPSQSTSSTASRGRQLAFPADGQWPEHRPRLGRDGQYRLPIPARRVRRPAPPPPPPTPARPPSACRQLKLPADGQWPENKPRLGKDGQYQLPLNVQRTRKPAPPPAAEPAPRARQSQQQSLPLNLPKVHPPRPSTRRGGER